MSPRKKQELDEKEEVKSTTSTKTKSRGGNDNVSLFTLAVVAIVILGLIGIVFGYTKDKLSELQKGGSDKTVALETQVENLKNQITELVDKAKTLEKDNQELLINFFDNNRKLPRDLDVSTWLVYNNDQARMRLQFPENWEVVRAKQLNADQPATTAEATSEPDATKVASRLQYEIVLQPKETPNFVQAITIKDDYIDFAGLSLDEKYSIFKELNLLDQKDFTYGKMLYFIDLDDKDNEIPTILILTENRILRATFNLLDKTLPDYMTYRKDFESIISTFDLIIKVEDIVPGDAQ
ncbi:hypothetical protein A2533_04690 [Candidatus Falkowbacteria bacterium RIFOXYD2_FULL_35_9]|uniref:Uncharacterized protein n=1 Tax=Candidatus Falkowbacteria bacterium RIFOXYC2_FULL_36_12 TaxID=1798002 RepID=A0A1F5T363_9BACT|nr:MAG: hypothetical protein A2478_01665 [Candidatus Falkowbacteria bacterium RIFOXYC2_FULL_36_12]OGF33949.1 MAG: hypothetical protein A2223_03305 [Candidatus Falkowbacteria bacterium RIFOXYA2_FULL_35_8]OGF46071.1 MAG: hypothetical protein A2533_04690 [Candidatus Falkowbacteria bacterium RIFOXYD2_FULL_35_9]